MRMNLWLVILAAVALPLVAAADAGVSGILSPNPSFNVSAPAKVLDVLAADAALGMPKAPDVLGAGAAIAPPMLSLKTESASHVRYRPAVYRPRLYASSASAIPLTAQIHIGFFHPIDNFSTGFDGGFRVGPQLDPHIQVGLAMDWWHRSDNRVLDLGTVEAPGGTASQELILSESSANLVPILFFVQVSGNENMSVIPYGGAGVGYEWLFLSANNYLTRESFDQTFDGLGWRVWVGAGLPLDWSVRLNGEVFFNVCEVSSEMDVNITDYGRATVRDVIKMNGVGMRLGLSWGF